MIKKIKKFFSVFIVSVILLCGGISFADEEVTFAHFSDVHIWSFFDGRESVKETYPERILMDTIDQINADKKVDFTLITGDVIDFPNDALFLYVTSLFNKLDKPWYFAIGNHDCNWPYWWPTDPLVGILKRVNPNFIENGRYYAFHPQKGFTFIALDGSRYNFEKEQLDFLNTTIQNNPDDVIVIFLHTPIMPPIDLETHKLWQSNDLIKLLKKSSQPIAVFAGHYHATKIIQDGNILHVATPSLRYAQEFRIVNIKNKKDKVIFTLDYKKTRLTESFHQGSRYSGLESDKNAIITINKSPKYVMKEEVKFAK